MEFNVWENRDEGYFEFREWQGVEVLFSLKGKEKVFLNYLANAEAYRNRPPQIVSLQQIHSAQVFTVDGSVDYDEARPQGDGLLTDKLGLWLTISVADCLPIYIYDDKKEVIGLVHAGKKGTQKFILRKALLLLSERFNSNPIDISLFFGPCICPECYDYDLWNNNQKQAEEMGVSNIINPKICTAESPSAFYSYRREKGTNGRNIAAIRLELSNGA